MTSLRRLAFPLFCLAATVFSGRAQPVVMTTNTILQDIVRQLAGDRVEARCLLPVGVDPHSFEPSPADVRRLAQAQLVVVNGVDFEPWLDKLVFNSGYNGSIVVATEGVALIDSEGHEHDPAGADDQPAAGDPHEHGTLDPHAWHDPRNVIRYARNIALALADLLPTHTAEIEAAAAAYIATLEELHRYATAQFEKLPTARRRLATAHDALRYLEKAYNLQIVPIAGLAPGQEPNPKALARLIDTIRAQHVPAVFFESTSSPKALRLIADEAGVATVTSLYTDSLGPAGSPGATYAGMFRHNVDTIVAALR
ncbi:MAG TPA: metal ABC transporter substrate-binding protein [Opitutaceae bacterium]